MPGTDAFLMPPRNPGTASVRVRGRSLCERAIFALRRSGIERITVSGECLIGGATLRRLARRGITLLSRRPAETETRPLVIMSADVVFEPAALTALVGLLESRTAVAAIEASPGTFAALAPDAARALRDVMPDRGVLERLDPVLVSSLGGPVCHAVATPRKAARAAREDGSRHAALTAALRRFARVFTRSRVTGAPS